MTFFQTLILLLLLLGLTLLYYVVQELLNEVQHMNSRVGDVGVRIGDILEHLQRIHTEPENIWTPAWEEWPIGECNPKSHNDADTLHPRVVFTEKNWHNVNPGFPHEEDTTDGED